MKETFWRIDCQTIASHREQITFNDIPGTKCFWFQTIQKPNLFSIGNPSPQTHKRECSFIPGVLTAHVRNRFLHLPHLPSSPLSFRPLPRIHHHSISTRTSRFIVPVKVSLRVLWKITSISPSSFRVTLILIHRRNKPCAPIPIFLDCDFKWLACCFIISGVTTPNDWLILIFETKWTQ